MRRALAPLLLSFLVCAVSARAQDDSDKDAPVGTQSPATTAWRTPAPAAGGVPPLVHATGSDALLESARAELAAEPAGRAKTDLVGSLGDLESAAAKLPPEQRQDWIDGHLGDFNEILRTLGADAPAPLVQKAARSAARLNSRAERWDDAHGFAETALSFDPNDLDALVSRSQANTGLGDYARAYSDAERAAKLAPDSVDALLARAAAAYGLGNYIQAIADSQRVQRLDPENKNAAQLLKLAQGRTTKIPDFEKSEPPQLADTVEREYHGMIQQLNQVEEMRQRPVEEPGPPAVARLVSSSGAKIAVKDYRGAVDDADAALKMDANNVRALYYRATAHNMIGEYGDAAGDATRGLTIAPAERALYDARAWAYNRMGRYVDAIADAHFALELDGRDGYALANRAYADEQRGDYESMAEDYKAAAALNPQFEPEYSDAARRHGLASELAPGAKRPPLGDRQRKQARSFALILFSSLLGGLLIAFGILHVSSLVKEPKPEPPPPPLAIARGIEAAYVLGKPLGQGGMGVVYEAVDRKLNRSVAIKMLRDEYKLDDAAKSSFMLEARTVAELHHPSIVDIHNIIEDERGLYLIFERLEGRTLDVVLAEQQRLPLSEIKRVLHAVCDALEYAHAHGVVHRDLKPGNVMLTEGGGVKVLDFGISRHAAQAGARTTTTRTVVGTPHYMAPEQEYGVVQKENDVFSLGAVLYEMVTGARPYEGAHHAKLSKSYLRASTRVVGVPHALDALIERSLEPEPEKRLKSPAEFWRLLDAVPDFAAAAEAWAFLETPAFRQSRPVLLTTFTNKVGSIGLSLITILLVKRGVTTGQGTAVLSALKLTMLAGTLAGGALTDRFSSRSLVLFALILSATGLGFLPFAASLWLIVFFGVLAQFAESLMNVVQRLLLMDQVDFAYQKESLGWMRGVNNFAQIFSFSVAALGSSLGVAPLMLFDSATSMSAFFLGRSILPIAPRTSTGRGLGGGDAGEGRAPRGAFFRFALVMMGWSFFYELFLEGGAGRLEVLHPGQGLRRFSTMMILNTVLCAAFAVHAARFFKKSWTAIACGMLLTALGVLFAGRGMQSQPRVFGGMLLITFGELMIGAVAQYTLMRLTPGDRNSGFYYSLGIGLMQCGRLAGASLAFPLLIHAASLSPFTAVVLSVLTLQLCVLWSLHATIMKHA